MMRSWIKRQVVSLTTTDGLPDRLMPGLVEIALLKGVTKGLEMARDRMERLAQEPARPDGKFNCAEVIAELLVDAKAEYARATRG